METTTEISEPPRDTTLYRLVMLEGPEPGRRYIIRQSSVLLGSDPKCRVQIEDPSIAGQHLALRAADGKVRLTVLDQADPVLFEDEPVWERYLEHGDIFCAGEIRFQYEKMVPLPFYETRPRGLVDRVSVSAVGVIFAVQLLLLLILVFVNANKIGEGELNLPSGEALAAMSPEEWSRLTNELTAAQAQLALLERDRASQSTEEIWDGRQSARLAAEIRAMQERVDFLDESIEASILLGEENQASTSTVGPAEPDDDSSDVERAAKDLLTKARREIAGGRLESADAILARLQEASPDMVNAYITRARLFERMEQPQEAIAQWDEVLNRVAGTEMYEEATAERTRLVRLVRKKVSEERTVQMRSEEKREAERREAEAWAARERKDAADAAEAAEAARKRDEEAARAKLALAEKERKEKDAADARAKQEQAEAARLREAARVKEELAETRRVEEEAAAVREREAAARVAEREIARARAAAAVRAPDVTPSANPPSKVRIASVRREKFENRENYEEIRLVRVGLTSRKSEAPPRAADVSVNVVFFDRDLASDKIEISRVPSPKKGLTIEGQWASSSEKTLSALYMVPKGFRRTEEQERGARTQYYGFVVQVFYKGALQDVEAFPDSLLERSRELL